MYLFCVLCFVSVYGNALVNLNLIPRTASFLTAADASCVVDGRGLLASCHSIESFVTLTFKSSFSAMIGYKQGSLLLLHKDEMRSCDCISPPIHSLYHCLGYHCYQFF